MTDLIALDENSRVWLYQADRFFDDQEIRMIQGEIYDFVTQWVSHSDALRAYGNIFHRRFIGLFVDESLAGASGCSIDSSVRFLNHLGTKFQANMIERDRFAYIKDDDVKVVGINDLAGHFASGEVANETLFFDHLVTTKKDFLESWLKPLDQSWHKRFL